jgi:hypothetical protein
MSCPGNPLPVAAALKMKTLGRGDNLPYGRHEFNIVAGSASCCLNLAEHERRHEMRNSQGSKWRKSRGGIWHAYLSHVFYVPLSPSSTPFRLVETYSCGQMKRVLIDLESSMFVLDTFVNVEILSIIPPLLILSAIEYPAMHRNAIYAQSINTSILQPAAPAGKKS